MFKRLFQNPTEKKRTRIKLTHNQKQKIDEAIKLKKIKAVYEKYGYKLPE